MSHFHRTLRSVSPRRLLNCLPPPSVKRRGRQRAGRTFKPAVEPLDALVLPNVFDWVMKLLPDLSFLAFVVTPSGTVSDATPSLASAVAAETSPSGSRPRTEQKAEDVAYAEAREPSSRAAADTPVVPQAPKAESSDARLGDSPKAAAEAPKATGQTTRTALDDLFAGRSWGWDSDLGWLFDEAAPVAGHAGAVPGDGRGTARQAEPGAGVASPAAAAAGAVPQAGGTVGGPGATAKDDTADIAFAASQLTTPAPGGAETPAAGARGAPVGTTSAPAFDLSGVPVAHLAGVAVEATASDPVGLPSVAAARADNSGAGATAKALTAQHLQAPLSFEANQGQTDPSVNFLAHVRGGTVFLTPTAATLASTSPDGSETALRLQLVDSNPDARPAGLDPSQAKSNYLIGNDPSQWVTGVSHYGQVSYAGVYQGIDLVYHASSAGGLEYDFHVAPGANPGAIAFQVRGADSLRIAADGSLVAHTATGDVTQAAPTLYQIGPGGQRQAVDGNFVLRSDNSVGFQVGSHDPTKELVIDPALMYSRYLGGPVLDAARAVASDNAGNTYVTGWTAGGFPVNPNPGAFQVAPQGGMDAFVTKLDRLGNIVWSTYLGGTANDWGQGIAVNKTSGEVYVTGTTTTPAPGAAGFPTTAGAYQVAPAGPTDAFVTELNASGTGLVYSTLFGGNADERGMGIAIDGGLIYVTGTTTSAAGFATTAGARQAALRGPQDAFVAALNPLGSGAADLVYRTYLGGDGMEEGWGIAVRGGQAYVTGWTDNGTNANNFPTVAPPLKVPYAPNQPGPTPSRDAFFTLVNGTGGFVYSTYLGGDTFADEGHAIAVDSNGNAYITGAAGANFPITAATAAQPLYGGGAYDAFIAKITPAGGGAADLAYSTFLGGAGTDAGHGIALLQQDPNIVHVLVTGQTNSVRDPMTGLGGFPVVAAWPAWGLANNGATDAFVTSDAPAVPGWDFSGYLGGNQDDTGFGIAVYNPAAPEYQVVGVTASGNFPAAGLVPPPAFGPPSDGFVTRLV